jgi:hypothetical protein
MPGDQSSKRRGAAPLLAHAHEPFGVAQKVGARSPRRRVPVPGEQGPRLREKRVVIRSIAVMAGDRHDATVPSRDQLLPPDALDPSPGRGRRFLAPWRLSQQGREYRVSHRPRFFSPRQVEKWCCANRLGCGDLTRFTAPTNVHENGL